jgi:hypothetical protein
LDDVERPATTRSPRRRAGQPEDQGNKTIARFVDSGQRARCSARQSHGQVNDPAHMPRLAFCVSSIQTQLFAEAECLIWISRSAHAAWCDWFAPLTRSRCLSGVREWCAVWPVGLGGSWRIEYRPQRREQPQHDAWSGRRVASGTGKARWRTAKSGLKRKPE